MDSDHRLPGGDTLRNIYKHTIAKLARVIQPKNVIGVLFILLKCSKIRSRPTQLIAYSPADSAHRLHANLLA